MNDAEISIDYAIEFDRTYMGVLVLWLVSATANLR